MGKLTSAERQTALGILAPFGATVSFDLPPDVDIVWPSGNRIGLFFGRHSSVDEARLRAALDPYIKDHVRWARNAST